MQYYRNDKIVRINNVIFVIATSNPEIHVGSIIPPNKYCALNTKYSIETLRDMMKLSRDGWVLVGFKRIRNDRTGNQQTDYLFDFPDKTEHNISVPRTDIIIQPLWRPIPGYSGAGATGDEQEYVPRHEEIKNISDKTNTDTRAISGYGDIESSGMKL